MNLYRDCDINSKNYVIYDSDVIFTNSTSATVAMCNNFNHIISVINAPKHIHDNNTHLLFYLY